jgi:hypothetical protein
LGISLISKAMSKRFRLSTMVKSLVIASFLSS